MENNQRITKQELEKIYGVDRTTIEVWRKRYGLPIIRNILSFKIYQERGFNGVGG